MYYFVEYMIGAQTSNRPAAADFSGTTVVEPELENRYLACGIDLSNEIEVRIDACTYEIVQTESGDDD